MKLSIVLAAALTLGSGLALADDTAAPPAGGKGTCKADVQKFCSGVERGEGRIRACLTEHQADLSDSCKQRMANWQPKAKPSAN